MTITIWLNKANLPQSAKRWENEDTAVINVPKSQIHLHLGSGGAFQTTLQHCHILTSPRGVWPHTLPALWYILPGWAAGMDACCSAWWNRNTVMLFNFLLIWQLCFNHDKGLPVMHEDPVASPWCLKVCSLLLVCCIKRNCLTLFWHGHSVELGLSSFTHHTPLFERCVSESVTIFWCSLQCAFPYMDRIWALLVWSIRGYASLFHIFFPPASGFDITLLSSWRPCCLLCEGGKKKRSFSTPLARSTHSRLYRFPLKLYLEKTGRMWALICPTLCNTWSGVAR